MTNYWNQSSSGTKVIIVAALAALACGLAALCVLGLGLRFGLAPAVFLRFDLRDYISSWAPRALDGFQFQPILQNELIGTIAVEFSLTPSQ